MENTENKTVDNANETKHYVLMAIGIFVGMAGIVLRYVADGAIIDVVANTVLIIGIVIGLKSVFDILK